MDEFELREILLRGEDSEHQFKRELDTQDKLAAEIVAFLNSRGGRIFVGVDDDGTIAGVSSAMDNLISNVCNDSLKPPCSVYTENVRTSDGLVIVITVPNGENKPYQDRKNQFWKKKGADKRKVTDRNELQRMFQDGHATYADLQPVRGATFADLDSKSLAAVFNSTSKGIDLSEDDDEAVRQLEGVRLMKNGVPSRAALLLFGKNPGSFLPEITTMAIWFKGLERGGTEYRDSRRFEGTLPEQYEQGMSFLRAWNPLPQTEGSSFNQKSEPLVPEFVFQEILINALVHRDYFVPDSIKIYIFDDRIEIISPGCLPNSLTSSEALQGIGRERNPLLLRYAYELMHYRGARSGLMRVQKAYPSVTLANLIEEEEVRVTIPFFRPS
jgi:ATP-dependent DNA helicase RecG